MQMESKCPECGGDVVHDSEDEQLLCIGDKSCLWWKDLKTGNEYGGGK